MIWNAEVSLSHSLFLSNFTAEVFFKSSLLSPGSPEHRGRRDGERCAVVCFLPECFRYVMPLLVMIEGFG